MPHHFRNVFQVGKVFHACLWTTCNILCNSRQKPVCGQGVEVGPQVRVDFFGKHRAATRVRLWGFVKTWPACNCLHAEWERTWTVTARGWPSRLSSRQWGMRQSSTLKGPWGADPSCAMSLGVPNPNFSEVGARLLRSFPGTSQKSVSQTSQKSAGHF